MEEGDKKTGRMLKMVEEPSGFLSTIQIGITLAGFLGSAFAAENFSDPLVQWITQDLGFTAISTSTLNTLSVVLITIILSYFTLIFGELVPKRIAMQRPMDVAKIASGVIRAIATVMRPVIWFCPPRPTPFCGFAHEGGSGGRSGYRRGNPLNGGFGRRKRHDRCK